MLLAAILLNQLPQIFAYVDSLIREAEKIRPVTETLIDSRVLFSYLTVLGLLISCSVAWHLTRLSRRWSTGLRIAFVVVILALIAVVYYVDSRMEVQLYEPSLHRSMFLAGVTLSMMFVGAVFPASLSPAALFAGSPRRKVIAALVLIILIASVAFTFAHFDRNQNLKTQVFYRTTQTKQYFKFVQWALDFDRDGYSAFLGGGDADDRRADINPGHREIVGDGIDNNCIGGDLTQSGLENWNSARMAMLPASHPSARRLNLIFIFIDAVRADRLGAYGYPKNTSPNIDKLAAKSSVFENGFTPSPYTYAALPKFMQSAYWDGHFETWTQVLARNGYRTILFPSRIEYFLKRHVKGIAEVIPQKHGVEKLMESTIETIGEQKDDRPFCAYLYIPDPHRPYLRHSRFDFGDSDSGLYDGEIAFTDAALGKLFDWMERSGRINDTMVVITSDHGESLGERAVYDHSTQLYNEQARVPMIFYVPNIAPQRIADYVSTIDLGTTILNIVGMEPSKESAGVSLLALMRGERFARPPVFGEQNYPNHSPFRPAEEWAYSATRKYMLVTQEGYKLIYNRDHYGFELYNLRDDPAEQHNLYDAIPDKSSELGSKLGEFIDVTVVSRPADAEEHWVEPPVKQRKRNLQSQDEADE